VALQALAAVLGGTQSLHTNSLDETYALPTEEAVTIALRTQQIVADESGVANTIDPLGGSYFVEWMTDKIERRGHGLHPQASTRWAAWWRPWRRATRSARSKALATVGEIADALRAVFGEHQPTRTL
jgi:methylmalonyl-CoA mutase N-terminal domain/subunit